MKTVQNSPITLNDLKTPKGKFLSGNLNDFKKKNKHRILEDWAKEYGELYTIKLGPIKALVSASTDLNAAILRQRPTKFRRLSKIDEVFVEMGLHTVFNAEGAHWRKQRKPVSEALNVKKVKGYYPIIQSKVQNLITKINSYQNSEESVEILHDFIAFTIDVTTEIAFGYQLNTLENKEDSFQNHLELIFPTINKRITSAFPIWRYFPSKKDKSLKKSLKAIEEIVNGFIKDAKKRLENDESLRANPSNFLEALLIESEKENSVFDEKTLYGNVIAMLIAGEDTTSNTLAWTLFYLAQYPEIVTKIRSEALSVYKNETPESYDQIAELKYTNAVIQEAIRLKPTTPILFFQANEDVVLNNVSIPKNTSIILQNTFATMQEENFSNANEFIPERWLKAECPYLQNHTPKAVKAFGGGPRLCPGMHLSITEMTAAISSICKQFDISLDEDAKNIHENFAFTVHPENLKVKFKKVVS
ncbi:cytochrome P450 [Tenacibaculum amylolyticum]|uniref:cytochrome P450 n=1 Tax=Tenacibaculum amylolyticum TaxID=104269 RepID=UPI003895E9B1